jgi:hypothetical protein
MEPTAASAIVVTCTTGKGDLHMDLHILCTNVCVQRAADPVLALCSSKQWRAAMFRRCWCWSWHLVPAPVLQMHCTVHMCPAVDTPSTGVAIEDVAHVCVAAEPALVYASASANTCKVDGVVNPILSGQYQ